MQQLKRIDFNKGSFVANGKTYYIESGLSISRFCEYQILEKEAAFATTFSSMFKELRAIYDLMNGVNFVAAAVKLDNLMSGITKLQEKEPTLLKIAALFINTEDEDRATITEDQITRKIQDWQEYNVTDFFSFALSTIKGFTELYSSATQNTLAQDSSKGEAKSKK